MCWKWKKKNFVGQRFWFHWASDRLRIPNILSDWSIQLMLFSEVSQLFISKLNNIYVSWSPISNLHIHRFQDKKFEHFCLPDPTTKTKISRVIFYLCLFSIKKNNVKNNLRGIRFGNFRTRGFRIGRIWWARYKFDRRRSSLLV